MDVEHTTKYYGVIKAGRTAGMHGSEGKESRFSVVTFPDLNGLKVLQIKDYTHVPGVGKGAKDRWAPTHGWVTHLTNLRDVIRVLVEIAEAEGISLEGIVEVSKRGGEDNTTGAEGQ